MNFVLIDGSYYVFFRYYALKVWWGLARKPEEPTEPSEAERFMEKFRTTFVSKIEELDKKLGISESVKIVGKDCPQKTIWRHANIAAYKEGRPDEDNVGPMFKCAYEEDLFEKAGVGKVVSYPTLEADDCLAITTKHILKKYPDSHVYIITSDMDYLQLASDSVTPIDLKFKKLTDSKNSFEDAEKDLFCKIVAGDKSDNIPSVFPRCGLKTAAKYYDNPELFQKKLDSVPGAKEIYERNRLVIDFDCIPEELVQGFTRDVLGTA